MIKPTLIIQDLSAVGQISLTVATAIFQALDLPIATAPSTILSTQTEGFGTPVELDTTAWLDRSFHHWQENQLAFNGVLVGYLGTAERIERLTKWVRKERRGPIVIDPVMGDSGSLYPGITSDVIPAMRELCRQADIITPNLTELRFLTGEEGLSVQDLLATAREMFDAEVVLTGVREGPRVNAYLLTAEGKELTVASSPCYPGHFFGTGDAFSALLTGWYLKGLSLASAMQRATADLQVAVRQTAALPQSERKFGLKTAAMLRRILTEC